MRHADDLILEVVGERIHPCRRLLLEIVERETDRVAQMIQIVAHECRLEDVIDGTAVQEPRVPVIARGVNDRERGHRRVYRGSFPSRCSGPGSA